MSQICLGHHQPAVPLLTEHIINLLKDAKLNNFSKHSKYVVQVAWSPDGQLLCTVSHDKTVVLYGRRSVASTCTAVLLVLMLCIIYYPVDFTTMDSLFTADFKYNTSLILPFHIQR